MISSSACVNCCASDTSAVSPGAEARVISEVFCVSVFSGAFTAAAASAVGVSIFLEVSPARSEEPPKSFMVKASQLERGANKLNAANISAAAKIKQFLLIFNFMYILDLLINIINP